MEHAYLDQLVGEKVDVDLVQHRRRQAMLADAHDRVELVRFRAQVAALGGGQREHWRLSAGACGGICARVGPRAEEFSRPGGNRR